MAARLVVLVLCCLLHQIASDCESGHKHKNTDDTPDYYWREFYGKIPYDAIPGGIDRAGLDTYVAQAIVHPHGLLPTSIYQGSKTVVVSAGRKQYATDQNIKVLCSGSPEKFQWIPTNINKIGTIKNCDLILGGLDYGYQENIGRINYNEEIILGKVIRKPLNHDGLWVPDNGTTETQFTSYEVLAFDCKP